MKEQLNSINLIVLYTDTMDHLHDELSAFGLVFERHKHGNGPIHYACERNGLCLEIYPTSSANPKTHTRIGLSIADMSEALGVAKSLDAELKVQPKESPWGIRAVIQLKTGMKIELLQTN